jgi:ABC-type branched-subunit amino acid transport system substrate-binding protein
VVGRHGLRWARAACAVVLVASVAASCGRDDDADDVAADDGAATTAAESGTTAPGATSSGSTASSAATETTAEAATTTTAAEPVAGSFGSLEGICGPGDAAGETDRGVTGTEIHIGVMGDPTNTVIPGAGQEFFDIAEAFAGWCNEAGGINGRQIVVSLRDAQLFDVGARMIEACESDFMLVGGANPLDEPGVEQRLGCGLAQIPAYVVSAAAATADLQVVVDSSIPEVAVGHFRALAEAFPDAFQAVSFISVDGGGLNSFAERQIDALATLGFETVDFQLAPVTGVDNWRPYAQNALSNGARSVVTLSPDIAPFVRAMTDVGWTPDVMPLGVQNYNDGTIQLAQEGILPPTWVTMTFWPFEAADENPATQQAIDLIEAGSDIEPSFAHLQALSAWLLWASAATACGDDLTVTCVIEEAGSWTDWTAGGLRAPVATQVGAGVLSRCFTLLRATPDGFVLDPDMTRPTDDIFHCDPGNVVEVADTHVG